MTFAQISTTPPTLTAGLPSGAQRLDTGAWVTPPKDGWTPDLLAACGWFEVTETPRPDPVDGGVHESTGELVEGQPVRVWTYRDWTVEELAARAEQEARFDSIEDRLARIEAHLWPAPPDPTTPDDAPGWPADGVWPDGGLLLDGGIVYRNVSGVPLTSKPSEFPGTPAQWTHLFVVALAPEPEPPAPTVAPWSATAEYKPGDRCTRNGRLYECLVAHGAAYAGTWGPPTVGVWKDIGPA